MPVEPINLSSVVKDHHYRSPTADVNYNMTVERCIIMPSLGTCFKYVHDSMVHKFVCTFTAPYIELQIRQIKKEINISPVVERSTRFRAIEEAG